MSDHIRYSHDLSDRECVDITKRNLTLITIGAKRDNRVLLLRGLFFLSIYKQAKRQFEGFYSGVRNMEFRG